MLPIKLVRSKRKTLCIEVTSNCEVVVRAPLRISEKEINRFIEKKADWIEKSLSKMKKRQEQNAENTSNSKPLNEQDIKLLTTRAKRIIPVKVKKYADIIGVDYGRITIRMQKSRWGSCSSKGNLNFNCLLMNAPDEITDYVIVHELCHRKEMNHSPKFWAHVEAVLPDYKERRKWLKDHGNELYFL